MKYEICESSTAKGLEEDVRKLIELGFVPVGGVSVACLAARDRCDGMPGDDD